MADLEQKFIQMEERLAFQEDTIQKLDDAMASQQRQLLEMAKQIQLLAEQLRKVETDLAHPPGITSGSLEDEKPPHY